MESVTSALNEVVQAINKFLHATTPEFTQKVVIKSFQYDADTSSLTLTLKVSSLDLARRPKRN
jgi:actin-like ATPase involved in cell morphogenesis